jgi:hypothetical protein
LAEIKKTRLLAFKVGGAYALYYASSTFIFEMIGIDGRNLEPIIGKKILNIVLMYSPLIFAIVYVQMAYKKELGNYITFGSAFRTGVKVAAYAGFFMAAITILYNLIFNTQGYHDWITTMEAANPHFIFAFVFAFTPGAIYFFIGSMVSLVSAAIIKRSRPFITEA